MATPNYSYEKRQKELAKKRKKEDKLKRKGEGRPDDEVSEDGAPISENTDGSQQPGTPATDAAA